MSTTSESLSSQAEQLQTTIAFFRIGDHGPRGDNPVAQLRQKVAVGIRTIRSPAASTSRKTGVGRGFALAMDEAEDHQDVAVRRA